MWQTAARLREALAGSELTRSDFRVPSLATTDLSGRCVLDVTSRGKHLLARVESGLTVHTHLRMDGVWHVYRAGSRPRGGPAWQIRLVLANACWQAVGYRLGVVELISTDYEQRAVGHLGPDPLGPDWDAERAAGNLLAQPRRPIGEALLDQRNLAGVGNLYKSEVCFLRGVSPWRPAGAVEGALALVKLTARLLDSNKTRTGQVTTGIDRPGESTWVYGRSRRPCRRCGTPVQRAEQGSGPYERVTFWCPRCQR